MTVVLDTNVVVALYDAADPDHQVVADWIATLDEDLVATPLAVAEMDYLVARRGGAPACGPGRRHDRCEACTIAG